MTDKDSNEWREFKSSIAEDVKQIRSDISEMHDDVLLLKRDVVPADVVHTIANGKVSTCKKHQDELLTEKMSNLSSEISNVSAEISKIGTRTGTGFFGSMTPAQRNTFISLVIGILFAVSGWIKTYAYSGEPQTACNQMEKENVSHVSK